MAYDKVDLENIIFSRAARLGEGVAGVEGKLACEGKDLCLEKLISVYNTFFEAENRLFLKEEKTREVCVLWAYFKAQQTFPPCALKRAYGVEFFEQDAWLETFLSR